MKSEYGLKYDVKYIITHVVRKSIYVLKYVVEHDENFQGLLAVRGLD